jgi:hypothetical protein
MADRCARASLAHLSLSPQQVPAGGAAGRPTHPDIETGYMLEGEGELLADGRPPLKPKVGDSY